MKQIAYTLLILSAIGCAQKKNIQLTVDVAPDLQVQDGSAPKDKERSDIVIAFQEATAASVKYKNAAAMKYAADYARPEKNSCGIFNNDPAAGRTDCAHFIAHCLKSGGIEIKAQTPDKTICKDGLCYRVAELTAALKKLSQSYANVQPISINDAIVGDYGFFKIPAVRPTHAFMICKPAANTDDIKIYAHTTNRDCEKPEPRWYQFFDVAYRITDAN